MIFNELFAGGKAMVIKMKKILSAVISILFFAVSLTSGFTAGAEDFIELSENTSHTVTVFDSADNCTAVFTASVSGEYFFYSTSTTADPLCYAVFDSGETYSYDDNYLQSNFLVEFTLEAGQSVTFIIGAYDTGTFSVTLSTSRPESTCLHTGDKFIINNTAATFNADGYSGDTVCSDCQIVISQGTSIARVSTVVLSKFEFIYSGNSQKPSVTVSDSEGKRLINGTDYTVRYSDAASENAGEYNLTVVLSGKYAGAKSFDYKISPQTDITSVLQQNSFTENNTVQKPAVTVTDKNGKELVYKQDYFLEYSDEASSSVGKYTVTAKMAGNYSGAETFTYYINPRPTTILPTSQNGLVGVSKGFTVRWKVQSRQTDGYQIQFATKNDFSNAAITTVEGAGASVKTITGRAVNTRYYVRIRTYADVDGTRLYSAWDDEGYIKSVVTLS